MCSIWVSVSAFLLFKMWFMLLASTGSFLERQDFRSHSRFTEVGSAFSKDPQSGLYAQWSLRTTVLKHTRYGTGYQVLASDLSLAYTFESLGQPHPRPIKSDSFGVGPKYWHLKKKFHNVQLDGGCPIWKWECCFTDWSSERIGLWCGAT